MANNLVGAAFLWLLFLVGATTGEVVAQNLDSTFIETFNYKARINGGLRYRDRTATFSVADREEFSLENRGLALRVGGRYKFLGYTFSIPLSDLGTGNGREEGQSFGLGLQFYRPKFYILTRFRNTRGFQTERISQPVSLFREDIKLFTAEIFGFHILKFRKFSLRSSFKQKSRQVQNHGSFLLGGLLSRQVLTADSLEIPRSESGTINVDRFAQNKIGLGVGYAHTFLFAKYLYFTPMGIVGPEFRFLNYDLVAAGKERERFQVSPRIRGRLAVGYNGPRNYAAVTATYLPSLDASDQLNTRIQHTEVELRIGRRF